MKKAISAVLAAATLGYSASVTVFGALLNTVNHDEHQFMASAYMVARQGLQPYRDFAYLQMPNLVYVYVPFFFTHNPFLTARLFTALCGFGLCLAVFLISGSLFRPLGLLPATVISAASTVLLSNTVLFQYASSRVWNHASATLCAVLAFLLHNKAIREARLVWFVLSGFALGMALGIRLTFAPLIVPFVLAILFFRSAPWPGKARRALAFAIGGIVGNLPAIYFCLTSYQDFVFGNLRYRQLDVRYATQELPHGTATNLAGKIHHLLQTFSPGSGNLLVPIVAVVSLIMLSIAVIGRSSKPGREVVFLVALLPFLLVGCFAPTPPQYQYYFALIPFLLLLELYALSSLGSPKLLRAGAAFLVVVAAISFFPNAPLRKNIGHATRLYRPQDWMPLQVEKESQWIKQELASRGPGKVLTLSPLYVIEAGLPIDKRFVTGPFAWRISHLISADEAEARHLPYAPAIDELLRKDPPMAVLTGHEHENIEEPIISRITALGYWPTKTPSGLVLWQPHDPM
jgi:hypothetical protein